MTTRQRGSARKQVATRPAKTWLVDLGNTRLKWAAIASTNADALAARDVHACAHTGSTDSPALAAAFVHVRPGDPAWLASVASPAMTAAVATALGRRGALVQRAVTQSVCAGVRIAYDDPSRFGVDRFLGLLAAHARGQRAWLVVGVGTALTIDLLAADGVHHGGLIAPSPTVMRAALVQRAPHLPVDGGQVLDFARDTADALASGAIVSSRALIAHSLRAARQRLGETPTLLMTGGGSDALCAGWRVRALRAPELVLRGLQVYAHAAGMPPRQLD